MRRLLPVSFLVMALAACAGPSARDREMAEMHRNIAQQSLAAGDPRTALAEIELAVERNPEDAEARNLYGLLLHLYFQRLDAAVEQYRKAIELRKGYSEAKVNLGAVLTAQGKCAEAIPLLEEARQDLHYREPWLAENNLGWCHYQLGDLDRAVVHLRAAIASNQGFCLGYRNLAEIAEVQGDLEEATRMLERYGKHCPDVADADYRLALVQLDRGQDTEARASFLRCAKKAGESELGELCTRQAEMIPEG